MIVPRKYLEPLNAASALSALNSRSDIIFTTATQRHCCATVVKIMNNQAKHYFHNWNTSGSQQHSCVPVVKIMFCPGFHYFHNYQNSTTSKLQDIGQVENYCCNLI